MRRLLNVLPFALLLALPACGSDDGTGPADPISGDWSGEFDNGIPIDATLALSGTGITGTFDTGDSQGTVSGTFSGTAFALQLAATTGTQRTLSGAALTNGNTRITADWDDGAGQNGAVCLAKAGSTPCP